MTSGIEAVLEDARALGLLGPGPIQPHLDHARAFVPPVPRGSRVLDLGSGGGLPGLVIFVDRRDATGALLDATERRCEFLERACRHLGLEDRVSVVCARAEDAARDPAWRGSFDVVTARSFGPPAVTAECAVGFLRVGGAILVSDPPDAQPDRWSVEGLDRLGLRAEPVVSSVPAHVMRLELREPVGERWPRRVGVPRKRPLW